jgi:hypothetical protein
VVWQPRCPQALAEAAVVADGEFLGEDQVEEILVAELSLVRPPGELVDGFRQMGQAELRGPGCGCRAIAKSFDRASAQVS